MVVDRGTYARQRRFTSSSSSSRSRQTRDDQADEEWMMQVNIFKYAIFFNFIQILLNCIPNDFLQQGYTLYSVPPPFPRPTTPGDPSTPPVDSS
jgi:hypothetical protein